MIIRNMETHSASVFKCNDWFSKTEGKLVKEIPAETDGEEMLKSKLFSALFNGNTLKKEPSVGAKFLVNYFMNPLVNYYTIDLFSLCFVFPVQVLW